MKTVLISLLLIISLHSLAQTDSVIYLKIPTGGIVNTKFLNTTATITTLNVVDSTKQLYVADTITGGTFNQYSGNDPVDTAIVFQDALGRKWKRNIPGGALDIRWFGAVPAYGDSYYAIQKAISYQLAHKGTYVYIPNIGTYFYSTQTIVINGNVIIKGDPAPFFSPTSKLLFPANKTGIKLLTGQLSMNDIFVDHSGYSGADSTAHGIEIHSFAVFNNVSASNASGNNLHIDACYVDGTNSDQSTFINCAFHGALLNGVFITGCDANIMIFTNCVSSDNSHWGFYDNGFLGNTYVQCQAANNGNKQDVIITYNGRGYVARNYVVTNNVNQKPDVLNSAYWAIAEGYGTRNAWDSTKKYYSGGAFASVNANAYSQYQNCYTEGYQSPSSYAARTQILGGIQAAGVIAGARIYTLEGVTTVTGSVEVLGATAAGTGVISSNSQIKTPDFYTSVLGGGLWFKDNRDLKGTGITGNPDALIMNAGNLPRAYLERVNGNLLLSSNANYAASERLEVNGNIATNGKIKLNNDFGVAKQFLTSNGSALPNQWATLDSSNIPQLATNTININNNTAAIATKGRVDSIVFNNSGLIHAPATVSITNKVATVNQTLANQNPFTLLGRGTGTGAPSFLAAIDSNYAPTLATKNYTNQQIATLPKADSAYAGYGIRFDSVYVNNKWIINIKVDSAKIATDTKTGLSVTGSGGTYNQTTGVLNFTGGGGNAVDTTTAQNVRGLKTFIGSTSSDGAPLTEQLNSSNWTSTGWTGTFGAGFTHTTGNTTPLTNTLAAINGQVYQITWTVSARTAGTFSIMFGGINITGQSATGNTGQPAVSTGTLSVTPTTDFDGTIIISVKSVGYSIANAVWASSDLSNLFQIRIPTNAYSAGLGFNVLRRVTTGINNLAFGSSSQQNTTSGSGNMSYGTNALAANNVGNNNNVFGLNAGQNTVSDNNNYQGYFAGSANTTGANNVGIGGLTLFNSVTGSNNVAAGNNAGRYVSPSAALVNCNNCLFLGSDTKAGADGLTNISAIGSGAVSPTVSNSMQFGSTSNTLISLTGRVITGSLTDNGTDQLQVTGTAKITGQLNIPNGTLSTSAVNLAQMNAAITAGGGTTGVDLTTAQDVRGTKTFIGSTATDAAPQSEQLSQANFTSTGWTGTMAAGYTNGASNVTPLTNTAAAVVGQYYQLSWTVTGWTAGSFTVAFGGITQSGLTATGNTGGVPATTTATYSITPTATFNGTIVPSVKYIGVSNANAVWSSSDNTSNLFQIRIPINAFSAGLGTGALRRITSGINNLAFGGNSQQNTTSGSGNVSYGTNTLAANNIGANNTVIGLNAGQSNTSGYNNAYVGNFAGSANTVGYNNVSIGGLSLLNATTAMGTTAIGNQAGRYIGSGTTPMTACTNCLFLGQDARAGADNLTNVIVIGNGATGPSQSNTIQIGNGANTLVNINGQVSIYDAQNGSQAVSLNQLQAAAASGTYTPSQTLVTNAVSGSVGSSVYTKSGNIIHCRLVGTVTPNAAGATVFNLSLPFTTATATQGTIGTISLKEGAGVSYANGEVGVNATTTLQVRFIAASTAVFTYSLQCDYQL